MRCGDVVRLRSGGQDMTVESVTTGKVECVWFQRLGTDGDDQVLWGSLMRETFQQDQLTMTTKA